MQLVSKLLACSAGVYLLAPKEENLPRMLQHGPASQQQYFAHKMAS